MKIIIVVNVPVNDHLSLKLLIEVPFQKPTEHNGMNMKIKMIKSLALMFLIMIPVITSADHEIIVKPESTVQEDRYRGPYLSPYLAIGYGAGGDVIARFTDQYGDVEKVRSGGGFFIDGGLLMAVDPYTNLRLTGGYEVDSAQRGNGASTFDRIRFDLMLLRQFGASELGVGLTAHTGVGYSCDINSICSGAVEFDSAVGYTVEYALTTYGGASYDRGRNSLRDARIGLRFTDIEYRPNLNVDLESDNGLVDGTSLSAFIGYAW